MPSTLHTNVYVHVQGINLVLGTTARLMSTVVPALTICTWARTVTKKMSPIFMLLFITELI